MIQVTMPRLSDTMEVGTVVKWNVNEGDEVSAGDVLADIETDKATMDLESFDEGTVAKISVPEGQQVAVGQVILVLAEDGEDIAHVAEVASGASGGTAAPATSQAAAGGDPSAATSSSTAVAEPPQTDSGARVFASPLARKIAAESGVDLGSVTGTGPSGRITRKDVEAVAGSRTAASTRTASPLAPAPAASTPQTASVSAPVAPPVAAPSTLEHRVVELSSMRGTIARRLIESKTTIPHYQVTVEADMDALLALRVELNAQLESQGVKLTVNDFLVRACALGMHQHPYVNSRWVEQGPSIEIIGDVNVGVAVALPEERGGGLVVATLRNADRMGLRQISSETRRLAGKVREKGLTVDEMGDSTFTISNLGMFGVSHFTAIINPPNAAILAVGGAQQRPVVRNGQVEVGSVMSMTMSSDHRIVDGAMAAAYLSTVRELLEKPATLLV